MSRFGHGLAALGAALALAACSRSEPTSGGQPKAGPPPAPVELGTVETGTIATGWQFLGRVEPALEAEVAAAVAGHVLAVKVREGDRVGARDVLVLLDGAEIRAELDAAKARLGGIEMELAQAKRQYERVKDLEYPTISEPERERYLLAYDTARAQLAAQRAEVQRLQVQLRQHTLRAPFDGAVRARHVDPGDWVSVGSTAVELVSLDQSEVHVDVSAELSGKLEVGQQAMLVGDTRATAEIVGIVPALDADTRALRVRLVPTERPAWLIAGMAIDVEFSVELGSNGVIVSRDALIRGPVETRVVKAVDGKGVPITVEVIATAEDRALVRGEGLSAGDQVVVRGNERLRPGQPLRAAE